MDIYSSSFEGEFVPYGGISELKVPAGWMPLWVQGTQPGVNHRPEYGVEAVRVKSGKQAAKFFTTHASHDAVLAKTLALSSSSLISVAVYGATFTIKAGQAMRVGIDPHGQGRFPDDRIIWSDWWGQDNPDWEGEQYHPFTVAAMPESNQITVYLHSLSRFAAQTVAAYWDDIVVRQEASSSNGVDYERIRRIVREELDATALGAR